MANLLVCFHTLADPDILSENEWVEGCAAGSIDFSYIHKSINSFDESALELALRYRDLCKDEETTLAALTIGDKTGETALRTLAALGFGHTIRIDADPEELTSESAANMIARQAKDNKAESGENQGFDLIITGQSSGDWNQSKVPVLIAGQLGIKCFTNVTSFSPADEKGAMVTWLTDDAVCNAYVAYPALLSIGDVSGAFLRVPTLRQRMDSKKQETEVAAPARGIANNARTELIGMEAETEHREAVFIDGSDAEAAAESMLSYFTEWVKE